MKIISSKNKLTKLIYNEKNLGFVPTMGGIHPGHVSLIKKSILQCDKTIVSIFVNKPQFNNKKDYQKYPRMLRNDKKILKKLNVDFLFLPTSKQIYPKRIKKHLKISSLENRLCGKFRPGHFRAVVDVVERFLNIIKPKKIYLGEKDFQQLLILEDYIKRKKIKTKVIKCKTIRENNGLPFSSRNFLLSNKDKNLAAKTISLIRRKKNLFIERKFLPKETLDKIFKLGITKIDYIKLIDINKIIRPFKKNKKYRIFIAFYIRSIRLIDNF